MTTSLGGSGRRRTARQRAGRAGYGHRIRPLPGGPRADPDGVSAAHGGAAPGGPGGRLESMGMVTPRRRVGITIEPSSKGTCNPRLIRWRLTAATASRNCDRWPNCVAVSNWLPPHWLPSGPTHSSAGDGRRGCRTWWCTPLGRSRRVPAGGPLSPHLAGSQWQRVLRAPMRWWPRSRSTAFAWGRGGTGPDPAVTALHDEVARAVRIEGDAAAAERAMRKRSSINRPRSRPLRRPDPQSAEVARPAPWYGPRCAAGSLRCVRAGPLQLAAAPGTQLGQRHSGDPPALRRRGTLPPGQHTWRRPRPSRDPTGSPIQGGQQVYSWIIVSTPSPRT